MDIENKGVETPVESEPTETESPAVEEGQGSGTQTPTESTVVENQEEPKDHKAFAELRVKNKQLEERLAQLEGQDNMTEEESIALAELRNPGMGMMPQGGFTQDMPAEEALGRMSQAERMAIEAKQTAENLRVQLENERLYSQFPELNPQSEEYKKPESKALEKLLAGQWLIARMSGKPVDLVKLAGEVKRTLTGASQSVADTASAQAVQNLTRKENATLEAKGNSVTIPKAQNEEERRARIRRGDQGALIDDLKDSVLKDLDIQ